MKGVTVRNGRIHSRTLEINVVDHCNLSCRGCAHFSPLAQKKTLPPERLYEALAKLAQSFYVEYVELMGGEPLLHPRLVDLARMVRSSRITEKIKVCTNGILLSSMDDSFWQSIDALSISEYPGHKLEGERLEHCLKMARLHKVSLEILHHSHFREIYSHIGTENRKLVERIYKSCQIAHRWNCYTIRQNYFFKCPQTLFTQLQFNPEVPLADGIEISDDSQFLDRLLQYLRSPHPLAYCEYCLGSVGRLFPCQSVLSRKRWQEQQEYGVEELIDMDHLHLLETKNRDEPSYCFTRTLYEPHC
ncbi:MAG: radical SAM protein [Deltaproteobacteria bacterium]|nr:radical SAM protein [Deltaproteobacteria bacterium]